MMSPLLSSEGNITCQNKQMHVEHSVGNNQMPAHQDQPNAQKLKTFAQLQKSRAWESHGMLQLHRLQKLKKQARSC